MFWAPIYLLKEELAVTAGVLVKGIRIMSMGSWAQGDVGLTSTNRGGSQAVHTEITLNAGLSIPLLSPPPPSDFFATNRQILHHMKKKT